MASKKTYPQDPNKPPGEACGPDGNLKETEDMDWSEPGVETISSLSTTPAKFTFVHMTGSMAEPATRKRAAPAATTAPDPKRVAVAKDAATASAGPKKAKPKKLTAVDRLVTRTPSSDAIPVTSQPKRAGAASGESVVPRPKKRGATSDVYTVFSVVDPDDESKGHQCDLCRKLKDANPGKYHKLQTIFKGNVTALRSHIARQGMDHYNHYRAACVAQGLTPQERAIPEDEMNRKTGILADEESVTQKTMDDYTTVLPKPTEWTKDGLEDKIIHFILETDQALSVTDRPSFRELLTYQRPKMKDSDIPHRTKITESITERAAVIAAELAKELQDAPGRISLTFDGWTSAIMQAYLAVTAHYITDDWVLRAELLTFDELAGSHSGENTAEVLYDILDKTKIKEKVSLS
ncbi:hypothetical protein Hypma_013237 [Hypsizygus marmoreus]|uniref:BED-type domain-containing protein n=1 Tax=Hypsizygus marmoreus TaxID=39966 RepID=A0A369JGP5_HYPMA|nr:hypothetical protein Hypma_013237 [Hypsizygus marmoreus]